MRDYFLDFYDSASNGYFSVSITFLGKDKACGFAQAVNSLRVAQLSYESCYSNSSLLLSSHRRPPFLSPDKSDGSRGNPIYISKKSAHCGRQNYTRELYFPRLATPDGTK